MSDIILSDGTLSSSAFSHLIAVPIVLGVNASDGHTRVLPLDPVLKGDSDGVSQRRLAGLSFEAVGFGHGKPITHNGSTRLRNWIGAEDPAQ